MKISTNRLNFFNGILQIEIPNCSVEEVLALQEYVKKGKRITIEIKRERRSKDANSLAWVLCHSIAEALSKDGLRLSAEDVYRRAIKSCGHCTIVPIKSVAIDSFIRIWTDKGIGWVVESLGRSKLNGYTNLAVYHGSSTYDSVEMARLINWLTDEASQLNIQLPPNESIKSLLAEWGERI